MREQDVPYIPDSLKGKIKNLSDSKSEEYKKNEEEMYNDDGYDYFVIKMEMEDKEESKCQVEAIIKDQPKRSKFTFRYNNECRTLYVRLLNNPKFTGDSSKIILLELGCIE